MGQSGPSELHVQRTGWAGPTRIRRVCPDLDRHGHGACQDSEYRELRPMRLAAFRRQTEWPGAGLSRQSKRAGRGKRE
jgi:hypothetical protein